MLFIMRSWDGMFLRTGDCADSVGAAASGLASDLVLAAAAAAAAAAGIGLVRMKFNEVQLRQKFRADRSPDGDHRSIPL